MVPPPSRRTFTMSLPGDSSLRRARRLAPWVLPSVLVHLGLVAVWFTSLGTRVQVEKPVPDWAIVLISAPVEEAPPVELPARPVERAPVPEREVVMPSTPGSMGGLESVPIGVPRAEGFVPSAERGPPGLANPGPIGIGPRYRASERLRAELSDGRLYDLSSDIVALSDAQKAELDLRILLAEVSDSIYAMEAAGRRMSDWTYTDANGKRWGISPGPHGPQLELGDLVIPIPFSLATPLSPEKARVAWMNADVAAQADRAEARATLKDRAAEIRRRRNAERAVSRVDTSNAKPSEPREDPPRTVR